MNQPKVVLALRLMKMLQNNETLTIDEVAARLKVQRIGEVEILERSWEYEIGHRTQGRDIFRMSGYANAHGCMQLTVRARTFSVKMQKK